MNTVELEYLLDLEILGIDLSPYTEEELDALHYVGRIVRNLKLMNELLRVQFNGKTSGCQSDITSSTLVTRSILW